MLEPALEPGPATGVRVLVVDDDPELRRILHRRLARAGFDVQTADDVDPAVAACASCPPDIALVDLGMPTSGLELVHRIKSEHGASVHVAVLTAHDGEQLAAFAAGADDFFPKSMAPAELDRRMLAVARRQRAFIEARQAGERAERLRAYNADASALLAHDINNGLSAALINLEYLQKFHELDESMKGATDAIEHALRRVAALVSNFVDVGRFEDAVLRPNAGPVVVRPLLETVVAVHLSAGRALNADVVCDPALRGWFDATIVERVLHNLVANAFRYAYEHGVVKVAARAWAPPDQPAGLELAVHNDGPPIPPDVAARIFSKYACGARGKRGMGLYFCRLACAAHGGRIELVAEPSGPTFVLRLPGPPEERPDP